MLLVNIVFSQLRASLPLTINCPMCEISNIPTFFRTACCSSMILTYCTGIRPRLASCGAVTRQAGGADGVWRLVTQVVVPRLVSQSEGCGWLGGVLSLFVWIREAGRFSGAGGSRPLTPCPGGGMLGARI